METQSAIPVTSVTMNELPHWLQDPQLPTPDDPPPPASRNTYLLKHATYNNLFESSLERIMGGTPLATIIASDPRGIRLGRFLFWIQRDPERRRRYEEACAIAAEAMAHELTSIADAVNSADPDSITMEDVQRSSLRMKARTYLMEKWSPQRYGDTRRVQIDSTSISASLSADDLQKMSIDDLKRMAVEMMKRSHPTDADVIDVTPDAPDEPDESDEPVERAA